MQDAGYHVLAGVLLFIAGILLIVAAVKIDEFILDGLDQLGGGGFGTSSSSISAEGKLLSSFTSPQMAKALPDEIKTEARKQLKFYNKLAGGVSWESAWLEVLKSEMFFNTIDLFL